MRTDAQKAIGWGFLQNGQQIMKNDFFLTMLKGQVSITQRAKCQQYPLKEWTAILMESPGNGLPLTEFPLYQTHYSSSCQPAPGACNTNIYKLNDGENMAHPGWQPVVK